MKNYLFLIVICSGCLVLPKSNNDSPVIFIEKSACFGECPVYKSEIYLSGRITYQGISNTKLKGSFCAKLDKKSLNNLIDAFNQNNYFSLNENYVSQKKDLPSTRTGFNYKGQQKQILDYDNAPSELKHLEKMLENIVDTTSWINCQ
jgi:hypothetical protein